MADGGGMEREKGGAGDEIWTGGVGGTVVRAGEELIVECLRAGTHEDGARWAGGRVSE